MSKIDSTLDSISGCGLQKISLLKKKATKRVTKKRKLQNLIDYLLHCDGLDSLLVLPPRNIHKEALQIKAIYPLLQVEVINNRLKISV